MIGLGVELAALLVVAGFVVIRAEFLLKPAQNEAKAALLRAGAAIHGLSLGLLVGFVLLPLRAFGAAAAQAEGLSDFQRTALAFAFAPGLILFIMLRQGGLSRVPLIGRPLRAYRRAALRRQIAQSQQALARLTALDGLTCAEDLAVSSFHSLSTPRQGVIP